jgi:amidohydrolase
MHGSAGERAALRIESLRDEIVGLSHEVHAAAELGFAEKESVAAIARLLAAEGHEAEVGCYGLETALRAEAGADGPRVGILAEYDALPDIGHACGHNIIGAAAVGTFLGVAAVVGETGGSVVLFGTPAEENGSGKEIMARAGAFADLDAVVMLHPSGADVANTTAIGLRSVEATYHGIPAHASTSPEAGRNALDAAVAAYQGVAALRQHIPSGDRVHGVITEGGRVANVVPARASIRLLMRSPEVGSLVELSRRVQRILEGAAMITETRLDAVWDRIQPCLPIRSNEAMAERFRTHLAARGRTVALHGGIGGSTDLGNVSLRVPSIHPTVAISDGDVVPHTADFAECAASPRGDLAVVDGAVAMARTAVDVLTDAGLRELIRAEFEAAGGVVDVPSLLQAPTGGDAR